MKKEDKKEKKSDKKSDSKDTPSKKKDKGNFNDLIYRTNSFDPEDVVDEDYDAIGQAALMPHDEFYDMPDGLASDGDMVVEDSPEHSPDPLIAKRLKGPGITNEDGLDEVFAAQERLPPMTDEDTEDLIQDPQAPDDVRRAAIARIRAKYLGQ